MNATMNDVRQFTLIHDNSLRCIHKIHYYYYYYYYGLLFYSTHKRKRYNRKISVLSMSTEGLRLPPRHLRARLADRRVLSDGSAVVRRRHRQGDHARAQSYGRVRSQSSRGSAADAWRQVKYTSARRRVWSTIENTRRDGSLRVAGWVVRTGVARAMQGMFIDVYDSTIVALTSLATYS